MRTEFWIVVCAVFAVVSFFGGTLYDEATSRPMIDTVTNQRRDLELLVDSLERREAELLSAHERGVQSNLPPIHVPAGGKVIRE